MWLVLATLLSCALTIIIIYIKQCHNYWQKRGVPCRKPTFVFGNMKNTALGKHNVFEDIATVYNQFPDCKYIGFYKFWERSLIIRDPNLANQLLVKDFSYFADNEMMIHKDADYITSQHIFVLKGPHWNWARTTMSPMFSSGKLKHLFPIFEKVSQHMTQYINKEISSNRAKCVNGKKLCAQFTIDNVTSSVFGLEAKSFEGESKFSMFSEESSDNPYITAAIDHILFMFPWLSKFLKTKYYSPKVEEYMTTVTAEALRYRQEHNINRNDFLDQITSIKDKTSEFPFTNRDIVAHAAGFFLDGVGTSSTATSYVLTEIGQHPEVQKKVRDEIQRVMAAHDGRLTYEGLKEMRYLDCVINETLRLHTILGALFKTCTKTYTLPEVSESNKTRLVLNPGDTIMIPVNCFYYDPAFYCDPYDFKPERFADENKNDFVKHTFLPFGVGPRHCMGMRFALIQIKCMVSAIIGHYQLDINEKMLPFQLDPISFLKVPKNGFWFDLSNVKEN